MNCKSLSTYFNENYYYLIMNLITATPANKAGTCLAFLFSDVYFLNCPFRL